MVRVVRFVTIVSSAIAAAFSAALAQTVAAPSIRHAAADAAGVLALHSCTGYFATEAPRSLIDETESTNGNPIAPHSSKKDIDEARKTISVFYASDMPPRIAVARGVLGCTLLPIGSRKEAAGLFGAPTAKAPAMDGRRWPMGDKGALSKLSADKDAAVEKLLDEAFKGEGGIYGGKTWGVVVVLDGKIVAERYQAGFGPHIAMRTNSMCKSLGGAMVGIAERKRLIDVAATPALAEWNAPADPRRSISLDDLMRMTSGLYTEAPHDPMRDIYSGGAAISEAAALNVLDTTPGSRFVYSGADTNLSVRAVREAIRNDAIYPMFPYRELLWKIGMTRTTMEMDWKGDFIASGQCWSTARDFGRLGMLYLADGKWNGEQLLPAGWTKYISTPGPIQPLAPGIGGDAKFGAQIWLFGGMDGLPPVAYSPFGARGQYAVIIPSRRLVVVRRGFDERSQFKIQKFAADVMNATSDAPTAGDGR